MSGFLFLCNIQEVSIVGMSGVLSKSLTVGTRRVIDRVPKADFLNVS